MGNCAQVQVNGGDDLQQTTRKRSRDKELSSTTLETEVLDHEQSENKVDDLRSELISKNPLNISQNQSFSENSRLSQLSVSDLPQNKRRTLKENVIKLLKIRSKNKVEKSDLLLEECKK